MDNSIPINKASYIHFELNKNICYILINYYQLSWHNEIAFDLIVI